MQFWITTRISRRVATRNGSLIVASQFIQETHYNLWVLGGQIVLLQGILTDVKQPDVLRGIGALLRYGSVIDIQLR